jgi:8-oxo-dGTP pyrophosphatase MutT (NUDIX family)
LNEASVVRAAGGLVWRRVRRNADVEIAIVHRLKQNDWSLPKGKLEDGESHHDAALREVWEETGLRCDLGPKLTETRYVTPTGEAKRVRWWAMTVRSDDGFNPGHETDGLRWVPLADIAEALDYDADRDVVHSFVTSGASKPA